MNKLLSLSLIIFAINTATAQSPKAASTEHATEAAVIKKLFEEALTNGKGYEWLRYLCKNIGQRLSGSSNFLKAVDYTKQELDKLGLDKVWTMEANIPHWERGAPELCQISDPAVIPLSVLALGGSPATPAGGVTAGVVEVQNFEELAKLGKEKVQGKIVFFNQPMDQTCVHTFDAYGKAAFQRYAGPNKASQLGAVACFNRSLSTLLPDDDAPHTGGTHFNEGVTPIPAGALGVQSANKLHDMLAKYPDTKVSLSMHCHTYPDTIGYNVIGEIKGSEFPDQVILVGGHLDSWDPAEGAHDDGAGVVQSMEVLSLMRTLGIKPRHTIRCVLFANEENGLGGGKAYQKWSAANTGEKQIIALETDEGGFTPRGFSYEDDPKFNNRIQEMLKDFLPIIKFYGGDELSPDGSGADIGGMKDQGTILFGYRPDSQRYFDIHHSRHDIFENINRRELEMGAATIAALLYWLDKYNF